MQDLLKYPFVFLLGFVVTYLLTPVVKSCAWKIGMVDKPEERRINKIPVPRSGGIAVFLGFHVACGSVFLFPWLPFFSNFDLSWWLSFLMASSLLLGVGIVDDIYQLKAPTKLLAQLCVAILLFSQDIRVGEILGMELPLAADLLFTVLWFIGIINAFNLVDGMDGLASGLAIIASGGLAAGMLLRHLSGDALVVLGLMGACLAFLRYNFHPASVFLGDSGSMFIGLALATLALVSSSKGTVVTSMGIALLAVGVPIFDTFLAVWRRSARSLLGGHKLSSLIQVDKDHLHHRLLRKGLSQRQVAGWLYLLNAALVSLGLASMVYRSRSLGIFLIAFVLGVYIVVRHLARIELWDTGDAILTGLRRPTARVVAVISYPLLDMVALSVALIIALALAYPHMTTYHALKNAWLKAAPLWIGVPFLAIAMSRTYIRVWSRARIAEFAIVGLALLGGGVLSLAVSIMAKGGYSRALLTQAVVYVGVSVPVVMGIRAFFSIVRDAMAVASRPLATNTDTVRRTLVYGAGDLCILYLRDESSRLGSRGGVSRHIVGLLDDDNNLRERLIYGYRVMGGIKALPRLIDKYCVEEIMIAVELDDVIRRKLMQVANEHGIIVMEWKAQATIAAALT